MDSLETENPVDFSVAKQSHVVNQKLVSLHIKKPSDEQAKSTSSG